MTGMNLLDQSMELLGYASAEGISGKDDMLRKAVTLINRVYSELYYAFVFAPGSKDEFTPIKTIGEEIHLPSLVLHDIAPYGLAMYLAQSESDADNQSLYASIYNQKKNRGKSVGTVKDRLPHVWG